MIQAQEKHLILEEPGSREENTSGPAVLAATGGPPMRDCCDMICPPGRSLKLSLANMQSRLYLGFQSRCLIEGTGMKNKDDGKAIFEINVRQRTALRMLWPDGPLSRSDLHEKTGVNPNAIGTDMIGLLHEEIVRECATLPDRRGRPPRPLEIELHNHSQVLGLALAGAAPRRSRPPQPARRTPRRRHPLRRPRAGTGRGTRVKSFSHLSSRTASWESA